MEREQARAEVTARAEALRQRGAMRALRAEREREVRARRAYAGGTTLHRPEPLLACRSGREPGRWIADGAAAGADAIRCGLDAAGRVVIAQGDLGGSEDWHLLTYGERLIELARMRWDEDGRHRAHVTHVHLDGGGRVVRTIDDWGDEEEYRWSPDGRLVEILGLRAGAREPSSRTTFAYDLAGGLARVRFVSAAVEQVAWDARLDAVEPQLPPLDELAAPLAAAFADALAAAAAAAVAELRSPRELVGALGRSAPLPTAAVLDAAWFADATAREIDHEGALEEAAGLLANRYAAPLEPPLARTLDTLDRLDADALRALRRFRQRAAREDDAAARERTLTLARAVMSEAGQRTGLPSRLG